MTDALVSGVVNQLVVLMDEILREEVKLVVGVDREIRNLESTFKSIGAVLVDAEKRQIKEETVKVWIEKLKDVSYDTDDVLAEWRSAILKLKNEQLDDNVSIPKKKVCFFISAPCFCFNRVAHRRDIALKIRDINERLDVIAKERETYRFVENPILEEPVRPLATSFIDEPHVYGRGEDKNTLVSKLLFESSQADPSLRIIAIVGMGGIGKTTLAKMVYNYDDVKTNFDIRMWVCVSEPFDTLRVAKAMVEQLERKALDAFELETVLCHVRDSVAGKKILLVLDDVWTEQCTDWEDLFNSLKNGVSGCKILVTTRNENVAKMMGTTYTLRMEILSKQDCWSLFRQMALLPESDDGDYKEFVKIGEQIAEKCKGLPLAAKTIGSLMRCKSTIQDWKNVLHSEMWELDLAKTGLFPPLLLSYYDLPSAMKPCFLYCANFPKDCKIEADNLIKLWMAHGYLNSRSQMEDTGREYLENLVMRSLFQDLEKDKNGDRIVRFKMHDKVHDVAQYLTKNECLILEAASGVEGRVEEDSTLCKKSRHLTLIRGDDAPFPARFENTEKLHTLWVQSFYDSPPIVGQIDRVPPNMFRHLTCLKALDLSRNMLGELPNEIGRLMNLRYLNLSHNPLEKLPETVCDLFNLQTLKLVACDHLSKLPVRFWKLTNLRHLEIERTDRLRALPKAVGRLSSLRTLSKFVISSGGDTAEAAACKIIELKSLTNLRGCLKIEGLGYVANGSEAEQAELKNKVHLSDLHLDFSPLVLAEGAIDVAEALQLHENLKYLQMKSYGGTQFPNWMISLTNLRNLQLHDCLYCICLPPLGNLPSLETLCIETMHNLKYVRREFLGVGGSSSVVTAFPKLKKLTIAYMKSWEEWDVEEENIQIMPRLRSLKLSHCERLKALPHRLLQIAPLKKLRIHNCPILQQRYQKEIGGDCKMISHIPKCRIW